MKFPDSTCITCGCTMIRHWDGRGLESSFLDETGSMSGDSGRGPEGVRTTGDHLSWLLAEGRMVEYSGWKARYDLGAGITPWQHWHKPEAARPVFGPEDVTPDDCCGMPMWLVRDGWVCRVDRAHRDIIAHS